MSHLLCTSCKKAFPLDQPRWRCECGSLLDIEWASTFDLEAISRRKPTMWRYKEAIRRAGCQNGFIRSMCRITGSFPSSLLFVGMLSDITETGKVYQGAEP